MTAITATPDTIAELMQALTTAQNELRKMRRVNHAFAKGHAELLRRGFSPDDYRMFADAIRRYPDYGPVPFSPRLLLAKMAQIERYEKQITIGQKLLATPQAS